MRFLSVKFGKRGSDKKGLARLLTEFETWEESNDDEISYIVDWCHDRGYFDLVRKHDIVDNRTYFAAYMIAKFGLGPVAIERLSGIGYSLISYHTRDMEAKFDDSVFMSNTKLIREKFPFDEADMADMVNASRRSSKVKGVRRGGNKVFGGRVSDSVMDKYKKFKIKNGCYNAEETITELIRQARL